ncbi:MAG: hypothetical protein F6J87_10855 [Spirulina sp. SIO3F2]|nr:hypothetical protein [Spirulina sp. SIO3F2]
MKDIDFYLNQATTYAGQNDYNADGSNFSLVPNSEKASYYEELHGKLVQQDFQDKASSMAMNWSIKNLEVQRQVSIEYKKSLSIDKFIHLCLTDIEILQNERYLVANLSPGGLAHFPKNTLGGAYLQYMCDGKFYEFDKNPLATNSDVEWFIRLLRQTHDFYHLVGEFYHYGWDGGFIVYNDPQCYERDLLVLHEEMYIYAFILGQVHLKSIIPIFAEWVNTSMPHCSRWLTNAYPLWLNTSDYKQSSKNFRFPTFIAECEKWMYASFKLNCLDIEICVDEYLEELYSALQPLPSQATLEEKEYRDSMLESFERGLRSKPLTCFRWDRYLGYPLQEVREFLGIPRRKIFKDSSHYIQADLY